MTQDYDVGPPLVNCPNGHPCNQYVTNCRICGAAVPPMPAASTPGYSYQPPASAADGPPHGMSDRDFYELSARRAADAALLSKYQGWKPLVIWYTAWTALLVAGAFGSFSAKGGGGIGVGFICLGLAALSALYARYLYRGGLRRVWFFIF